MWIVTVGIKDFEVTDDEKERIAQAVIDNEIDWVSLSRTGEIFRIKNIISIKKTV